MKTTRVLGLAILAGSLATSFSTFADSPFSERDAHNNAAVANSPRARESFPWLTRKSANVLRHDQRNLTTSVMQRVRACWKSTRNLPAAP
jgi:hypothetical protein